MKEHNFELGQWVTCEGVYMQIMALRGAYLLQCRFAGRNDQLVDKQYSKLVTASLTPDFTNARDGDSCFSTLYGNGVITDKVLNGVIIQFDNMDRFSIDNYGIRRFYAKHPFVFNSFTQFQAYWAEEHLAGCV